MSGWQGFFRVRSGERTALAYFLRLFFLLGIGMAIGRGSADALFFKRYGIEFLPQLYLLLGMLLFGISVSYAAFADRLPAERFFRILCLILAVLLAGNWLLMRYAVWQQVYPLYFLLYEIASELLLVHAGLYVAQNFHSEQARRLLPLIFAAMQAGSIVGGLLLSLLAPLLAVENMLLLWALTAAACAAMLRRYHGRNGASAYFRSGKHAARRLRQAWDEVVLGVRFTGRSRLLWSCSMALFFTVIVFYSMNYAVNRVYTAAFHDTGELAQFFGALTAVTGIGALLLQVFVTGRALDRFGVKTMNMLFPAAVFLGFGGLLLSFSLPAALYASCARDVLNPAVRGPVRDLFLQALPAPMAGRARAMAVALVMPFALALTGGLLWWTQRSADSVYFLLPGLAAAVGCVYYAVKMNRAYVDSIVENLRANLFVPGAAMSLPTAGGRQEICGELQQMLIAADEEAALLAAESLLTACGAQAVTPVLQRVADAATSDRTADCLLRLLGPHLAQAPAELLQQRFARGDDRIRATLLLSTAHGAPVFAPATVAALLQDAHPRLRAAAVFHLLARPSVEHADRAQATLTSLLDGTRAERYAALEVLERLPQPQHLPLLLTLLDDNDARLQIKVLRALAGQGGDTACLGERLHAMFRACQHSDVRQALMQVVAQLPGADVEALLLQGAADRHPRVRQSAIAGLLRSVADKTARLATLSADSSLHFRARQALALQLTALDPPTPLLESLAEKQARQARQFAVAMYIVGTGSAPSGDWELLLLVLRERTQQAVDLVLILLGPVEGQDRMATVRAALQSDDNRYAAAAGEVVRHLANRRLAFLLGEVLDFAAGNSGDKALRDDSQRLRSTADVLRWAQSQPDAWLAKCAMHAATAVN